MPVTLAALAPSGSATERGTERIAAWWNTAVAPRTAFSTALALRQVAADDLEAPVALGEVEVGPAAGGEVVEDPDPVALAEEALDDVRADEARAAGHQVEG